MKEEIFKRLIKWGVSEEKISDWYENVVISSLGNTAKFFVDEGQGNLVIEHLNRIEAGGYS